MLLHPLSVGNHRCCLFGRDEPPDAPVLRVVLPLQKAAPDQRFDADRCDPPLDAPDGAEIPRGVVLRVVCAKKKNVEAGLIDAVLSADGRAQCGIQIGKPTSQRQKLNSCHEITSFIQYWNIYYYTHMQRNCQESKATKKRAIGRTFAYALAYAMSTDYRREGQVCF